MLPPKPARNQPFWYQESQIKSVNKKKDLFVNLREYDNSQMLPKISKTRKIDFCNYLYKWMKSLKTDDWRLGGKHIFVFSDWM